MGSAVVYILVARCDLARLLSAHWLWRPMFLEKVDASELHCLFEADCPQITFTSDWNISESMPILIGIKCLIFVLYL